MDATPDTPKRRWSPVTEATVAVDYLDGLNLTSRPHWPRGWRLWRQAADMRDAETLRRLKGFAR